MATLLFDSWGTLVDNYSISEVLEPHVHSSRMGNYIAEEWRTHQKWMMFYLTLAEHFLPHPGTTESALRYTLDKFHIKLSEAAIKDIMSKYHQLRAYPDVPEGLRRLREQGHVLKIVANPTKQMLEDHTKYAGIRECLDEIISSGDEAKAFKPSPKVYQLGLARAGTPKENILWVTGHFWEVVGAAAQGIKTAWVNRMMLPHDYVGVTPTYQTTTMTELADVLAKKEGKV
jgi:2-haloacid dehalogenase